jgi:hypothetical protein
LSPVNQFPSSPLVVYLDLSRHEYWERREWEALLSQASPADLDFRSQPAGADCELTTGSIHQFRGSKPAASPPPAPARIPKFVWDHADAPTGYDAGLYCSLPRYLHNRGRHRSFCYPLTYNEMITAFALEDADRLFGFCGSLSSGLRVRMMDGLLRVSRDEERILGVQDGPWNAMYDRGGLPVKKDYAQVMRRCRFSLCPRGNGVSSIRLFETMKAARVPVILSDEYVLPEGIAWEKCSVVVKEKDLLDLPRILREKLPVWEELAINARAVWEENFSDNRLFVRLAQHLRELIGSARPIDLAGRARILTYPSLRKMSTALIRGRQEIDLRLRAPRPAGG